MKDVRRESNEIFLTERQQYETKNHGMNMRSTQKGGLDK